MFGSGDEQKWNKTKNSVANEKCNPAYVAEWENLKKLKLFSIKKQLKELFSCLLLKTFYLDFFIWESFNTKNLLMKLWLDVITSYASLGKKSSFLVKIGIVTK